MGPRKYNILYKEHEKCEFPIWEKEGEALYKSAS